MEVLTPSTPNGASTPIEPHSTDPLDVLEHIASLIQTALGAARRELECVGSLLSKAKHSETLERCARFASETEVALYAQKDVVRDAELTNGYGDGDSMFNPSCPHYLIGADMISKNLYMSTRCLPIFRALQRPSVRWPSLNDL